MKNTLAGRATLGTLLAALAVALAGCGGGGGGGGGSSSPSGPSTVTVSGLVMDGNNNPAPGFQVVYDQGTVNDANATLSATTNAQGQYSITVPVNDILGPGKDTITVYDPQGGTAGQATVTVSPSSGSTTTAPVVTAPPMPPPAPLPAPLAKK